MRLSPRWEQAVHASLDQMVRLAARPAQGMVPADAEAVLFADRAELLACLAQDWCEGAAIMRWWWQSLFRSADSVKVILASWREAPQYIPGTLHSLAMNGKAVQFMRALSVPDARAILERMTEVFALSELRLALKAAADREPEPATQSDTVQETPEGFYQSPPWQRWVPEGQGDGLAVEQQCVLGLGLMLYRAQLVVRTEPFAQAVVEWKGSQQRGQTRLLNEGGQERIGDQEQSTLPPFPRNAVIPAEAEVQAIRSDLHVDSATMSLTGQVTPIPFSASRAASTVKERGDLNDVRPVSPQGESIIPRPETEAGLITEASVETAFGGVFYLMNFALYLNLYGDFSTPLQPGIALSPWDFLALVGEQIIGERIHVDPVWPLLAQLAGRDEGDVPGQDFNPSAEWRLQMMEQWGYDDPSTPDQVTSTPFIEWLMPFVLVRLMQALGLDQEHELTKVLCEHRANVHVTATHVDVMLSLADLPIAIRFAGLDRNPGWIPAAGRYLAFHFE
jgi:hypothetical protein